MLGGIALLPLRARWRPSQVLVLETVGADSDGARLKQRAGGKAGVQFWRFHSKKGNPCFILSLPNMAFSRCEPSLLNSSMISCG
jgi:hypothetical protein